MDRAKRRATRRYLISLSSIAVMTLCFGLVVEVQGRNNPAAGVAADNTGVNKRDRAGKMLTAEDQAKASRQDNEITRRIREEITKNSQLSSYGQNVKIITLDGVVTLRGPVKSQQERDWIVNSAQQVSGIRTIQNELEIVK